MENQLTIRRNLFCHFLNSNRVTRIQIWGKSITIFVACDDTKSVRFGNQHTHEPYVPFGPITVTLSHVDHPWLLPPSPRAEEDENCSWKLFCLVRAFSERTVIGPRLVLPTAFACHDRFSMTHPQSRPLVHCKHDCPFLGERTLCTSFY